MAYEAYAVDLALPSHQRRHVRGGADRRFGVDVNFPVCDFAPNAARGDGTSDDMQTLNLSRARSFYWSI